MQRKHTGHRRQRVPATEHHDGHPAHQIAWRERNRPPGGHPPARGPRSCDPSAAGLVDEHAGCLLGGLRCGWVGVEHAGGESAVDEQRELSGEHLQLSGRLGALDQAMLEGYTTLGFFAGTTSTAELHLRTTTGQALRAAAFARALSMPARVSRYAMTTAPTVASSRFTSTAGRHTTLPSLMT